MHNKVREPLFHIVKRDTLPWYQAWGIRAVAIVLALLLCALITTLCTHLNPIKVFGTMFSGAFGSPRKIWILGQNLAILLCISLAVTPAFKMRFWNIGAEGQVLAGGLAAAACMICLGDKLPNGLLIVLIVIAGILAGAVWAVIPAIFKAKWNTNETLFTLMMNYVATQLVAYFIIVWESPKGSGKVGIINQSTEAGWLPQIGGYKYLLTILVVAVLTVLVYVYLNYSKHGYEISVVGESERTARYVGIKVGKVIVRTMLLSGALCGIAGAPSKAKKSPGTDVPGDFCTGSGYPCSPFAQAQAGSALPAFSLRCGSTAAMAPKSTDGSTHAKPSSNSGSLCRNVSGTP